MLVGESPEDAILRLHGEPDAQYRYRIQRENPTTPGDWVDLDMARVTEPREIDAIEDFVITLVKARQWGPGRYRYLGYYGRGSKRFAFEPVEINLGDGMPGLTTRVNPATDAAVTPLAQVSEVIRVTQQVQSLSGTAQQAAAVGDAVKTGIEIAAAAAPKPLGPADLITLLDRVVDKVKPAPAAPDTLRDELLRTLLERTLAAADVEPPEPEKPKTLLEQLEEARAMMALVGGGKGSAALPTEPTIVLLAKSALPHIGPAINDLFASIRLAVEKWSARAVVITPTAAAPAAISAPSPAPAQVPAAATPNPTLADLVAFVDSQVAQGDATFPAVIERFEASVPGGREYLDQIRQGAAEPGAASEALAQLLAQQGVTLAPTTLDYLRRLFASLVASPTYRAVRQCGQPQCRASFGFDSMADAAAATQCQRCGGDLAAGVSELAPPANGTGA